MNRLSYVVLAFLLMFTTVAEAIDFNTAKYDVYKGDINQDGKDDYYFHAVPQFVLLYADISIPLILPPETSYKLVSTSKKEVVYHTGGGSTDEWKWGFSTTFEEVVPPLSDEQITNLGLILLKEGEAYFVKDFTNDNKLDLFLPGTSDSGALLYDGADPMTPMITYSTALSRLIQNAEPSISLKDVNSDGYIDIIVPNENPEYAAISILGGGTYIETGYVQDPIPAYPATFVGSTGGEFRVSESGAATYNIPISLPVGIAGVQPSVSLAYSSQNGNGVAGLGWSLSAGSGISRCANTLYQDGVAKPIKLNQEDKFCLDGQRLVLVDGDEYGAAGSTYKTEIDNLAVEIKAVGGTIGNPNYFTVIAKDGSLKRYGYTANSKAEVNSNTVSWSLSDVQDNMGNTINYYYSSDFDNHRLTSISYAAGEAEVLFNYTDNRPDPIVSHLLGQKITTTKRLSGVTVKNSGNILRNYYLTYLKVKPDNTLSRIQRVQECAGNANNCLPALEFDWKTKNNWFSEGITIDKEIARASNNLLMDQKQADINGDGCVDLVYGWLDLDNQFGEEYAEPSFRTVVMKSQTSGAGCTMFSKTEYITAKRYEEGDTDYSIGVLDYNADGRQDVVIRYNKDSAWHLYLSKPKEDGSWGISERYENVSLSSSLTGTFIDVNADGLVDLVGTTSIAVRGKATTRSDTDNNIYGKVSSINAGVKPVAYGDFNGDGQMDVVRYYNSQLPREPDDPRDTTNTAKKFYTALSVSVKSETGYQGYFSWTESKNCKNSHCSGEEPNIKEPVYTGDFNGDGLTDIIYTYSDSYKLFLNNGSGFDLGPSIPIQPFYLPKRASLKPNSNGSVNKNTTIQGDAPERFQVVDFNQDGYSDIFWQNTTGLRVAYWQPYTETFTSPISLNIYASMYDTYTAVDANSDGSVDIIRSKNAYNTEADAVRSIGIIFNANGGLKNVVTRINNNFGSVTNITYNALNKSRHYGRLETKSTLVSEYTHPCYTHDGTSMTSCTSREVSFSEFYRSLNNPFDLEHTDPEYLKPVYDLYTAMPIVTSVESSSPTANNPNETSAVDYLYTEAKLQGGGRGFLGFKTLSTVDKQTGIRTVTTYNQQFPFIGSPMETTVYAPDGEMLSRSENRYEDKSSNDSYYQPQLVFSQEKVYPNSTNTTEETSGEGDGLTVDSSTPLTTVTTTTNYDNYGNVTFTEVKTEGNYPDVTSGGANKTITQTKVTDNTFDNTKNVTIHGQSFSYPQLGRLTKSVYTGTRDGITTNREIAFTYLANGLLDEETIVSTDQSISRTTKHRYDAFGNKTKQEVTGWDGQSVVTRANETTYDAVGRYPIASKDGTGKIISEVFARDEFGRPTITETVSGVITTIGYDALGREITKEDNTAENRITTEYLHCNQVSPGCPIGAQYAIRVSQQHGTTSITYFDKVGKPIRKAALDFENRWVISDTQYDYLGRTVAVSAPYFSTSYAQYWTTTTYDVLGRVRSITAPADNDDGFVSSSVVYDGAVTTTANPNGQTKRETKNSFGELIQVEDNVNATDAANYALIRYVYDSEGNLTDTNVHTSATSGDIINTHLVYDDAGRKKSMTDVDKGTWSYTYNAFGELISQTDAKNQMVKNVYDAFGRIKTRTDYTDATATNVEQHTRYYYDGKTDIIHSANDDAYGQVSAVIMSTAKTDETCSSATAKTCEYTAFDEYGRGYSTTKHIDTDNNTATPLEIFTSSVVYDTAGRVEINYDALHNVLSDNGTLVASGTVNHYTPTGFLAYTSDIRTGEVLYKTVNTNQRGQVIKAELGGLAGEVPSYTRTLFYSAATGRLQKQMAYHGYWYSSYGDSPSVNTIQHIAYNWDDVGNLLNRQNQSALNGGGNRNLQESFCYDSLNRLVKTNIGTTSTSNCDNLAESEQDVKYNSIGNITYKEGVGAYTYHTDKRHAVHTAGGSVYQYDNNGNNTLGDGRSIDYSTFDKPLTITKGSHTSTFAYGADRSRYLQIDSNTSVASKNKTTLYLGNIERIQQGESYEWRRTVPGGQQTVTTDTANNLIDDFIHRFIFNDHLGSVDVIALAGGVVEQSLSFNPWGERRKETSTLPLLTASELFNFDDSITSKGYTGHEMLDEVGLIHMNGRIYDAKLARFLQADPFVQAAKDTQMYNRYSYVRNNPLNATDPSGYFLDGVVDFLVGGISSFVIQPLMKAIGPEASGMLVAFVSAVCLGWAPACAAIGNYHMTRAFGGSVNDALKAGAIAGASAWAFSNAVKWSGASATGPGAGLIRVSTNTWATGSQFARLVMIHGSIGGVTSVLQGGKFGHGFASAGVTKLVSPAIGKIDVGKVGNISVVQTFVAAAVGGTVSDATGGKFANGAITAAYGNLFNQQGEVERRKKMSAIKNSVTEYRDLITLAMNDLDSGGDPRSVSLIVEGFNGETTDSAFAALLKIDSKLQLIEYQLMNESGAALIDSVTKNIVKSAGAKLGKPPTTGGIGTKSRHPVISFITNMIKDEIKVRAFNDYNASTMCSFSSCQIYVNEVLIHEK